MHNPSEGLKRGRSSVEVDPMNPLHQLDHRPECEAGPSLPEGRWAMTQTWHNLLYAHWPLPPEALRPAVPPELEIDTFNGAAWLGIVIFRLSGIRLRGLPEVPFVSRFPEINVRTYVTHGGKSGVYFLSLDTDNRLAIALARPWFRLAYYYSRIGFREKGNEVRFRSRRVERNRPGAEFAAAYHPCGPAFRAQPGTLEHWLTERYCYYSVGHSHQVYRCDIHHAPWQLRMAQARITENTMALSHGIELPETEPSLLYARYMKALIWRVSRDVGKAPTNPCHPERSEGSLGGHVECSL